MRGVGVEWVRTIRRTYDVAGMRDALREALTTKEKGPKVLIAQSECHAQPAAPRKAAGAARRSRAGERVVRERFGVDADTCTGDHSCIRLSGCPSLSIKPNPDPLRTDPVATVLDSCVGCGVCGEVVARRRALPLVLQGAHRQQPERAGTGSRERVRGAVIGWLQRRDAKARARRFVVSLLMADREHAHARQAAASLERRDADLRCSGLPPR